MSFEERCKEIVRQAFKAADRAAGAAGAMMTGRKDLAVIEMADALVVLREAQQQADKLLREMAMPIASRVERLGQ